MYLNDESGQHNGADTHQNEDCAFPAQKGLPEINRGAAG
jgi:hypothetical protein